MQQEQKKVPDVSVWSPFRSSAFALLWTATLISTTGGWMHDVGAGWLMTTLNPSPAIVSLVQAASTLPIFLFALLAGAIADRVDKKRMLLVINVLLFLVVTLLSVLVYQERMTPALLLLFTLIIGTGSAFMAPAWQSVVPTLVPREQFKAAVALNSLSVNISRAVGPALAGILIAAGGLALPFVANALSFLVIIAALVIWQPRISPSTGLPPERLFASMMTGIRHVRHNPPMIDTLIRAAGFFFFAATYWALLPLVARAIPGAGAGLYGILLGAIGTGAVFGALILPRIRQSMSPDWLVFWGSAGTAIVMITYAVVTNIAGLIVASFIAGLSWISVLTCFNVSAQTALPDWVRARGLAVYLMVFFGSLSLGSAFWGQVAAMSSNTGALLVSAILMLVAIPLTWRAKLGRGEELDLSPSTHWPDPGLPEGVEATDKDWGPVLINITYRIAVSDKTEFLKALHELSKERYRDGAYQWGVEQDVNDPQRWVEWFKVESWNEHLRQHQRVTMHDKALQEAVRKYHQGPGDPEVRHLSASAGVK